jgi:hypothetical protein
VDQALQRGAAGAALRRRLAAKEAPAAARRTVSQAATKLAGCVFLAVMVRRPHCLSTAGAHARTSQPTPHKLTPPATHSPARPQFPAALAALADPALAAAPLYGRSPASRAAMAAAAGYFLFDLAVCLARFAENGPAFLLHASACCGCYWYTIATGRLHRAGAGFLMWELSTPFLYARWAARKARAGPRAARAADAAFVAAFFGCRVIFGPLASATFYRDSQADLAARAPGAPGLPAGVVYAFYAAMATLNVLNLTWFARMVGILLRGSGARPAGAAAGAAGGAAAEVDAADGKDD